MLFTRLDKDGPVVIDYESRTDDRGSFSRFYCRREFIAGGLEFTPVQANISKSLKKGTIRGLHFQVGVCSETKLIRVMQGSILDVCVNLIRQSPNYGRVYTLEMKDESNRAFLIPKGFAHGFQTLQDNTQIQYLVDNFYDKSSEQGIIWNDSRLNIPWPFEVTCISKKDRENLTLDEYEARF